MATKNRRRPVRAKSGLPAANVTALLGAWQDGDPGAAERLMALVYDDLRRLARRHLRGEGRAATLRPTELVHESYVRLLGQAGALENRAHFFALAATMMRRILVDRARRRHALRRGGVSCLVPLDGIDQAAAPPSIDVIALDAALEELAALDPRQAQIVELHFFGGLPFDEVATVLETSPSTIFREWRVARLWLLKRLSAEGRSAR
jgi:RNA polymerase sigma factor (TIGR02999 family)